MRSTTISSTLLLILLAALLAGCDLLGPSQPQPTAVSQPTAPAAPTGDVAPSDLTTDPTATVGSSETSCIPTQSEANVLEGPDPPMRVSVGTGHVLSGVVKSSEGCSPIPNAKIIYRLANSEGSYVPENEGTVLTGPSGDYRIESEVPGRYEGAGPHIHLHVSADGYNSVLTTYVLTTDATDGTHDVVLVPAAPEATSTSPGGGKPFPTQAAATPTGATQPTATATVTPAPPAAESSDAVSCVPTRPGGEGPFYVPNAPVRSSVGTGHVLKGVVRSSKDCAPVPNARIEFWLAGPNAEYDDDHRATLLSDDSGSYTFESNFPPGYSGRPPHIHIKVTADAHQQLTTQYYPNQGDATGTFDLVLIPE